jgi:hypothetical protein
LAAAGFRHKPSGFRLWLFPIEPAQPTKEDIRQKSLSPRTAVLDALDAKGRLTYDFDLAFDFHLFICKG